MTTAQLVPLIVTALTSGLVVFILTNIVTNYKNRIQPIGLSRNILTIAPKADGWAFNTHIGIETPSGFQYAVDKLFIAEVNILNRSNKDLSSFDFGITLPRGLLLLDTNIVSSDRHHTLAEVGERKPSDSDLVLDFQVKPFNRGDSYGLRLAVVPVRVVSGIDQYQTTDVTLTYKDVVVSTAEVGVRFVDLAGFTDALAKAYYSTLVIEVSPWVSPIKALLRLLGRY